MSASSGRIRSGRPSDLEARDGSSVVVRGTGHAGLTAVFERVPAGRVSIEYRARSSTGCRHSLAVWDWRKRRWLTLAERNGRSATVKSRPATAAVSRSKPIKLRAGCARPGAEMSLRIDVLRVLRDSVAPASRPA